MRVYYITFRSVTFAQRGEKLLKQHNIHGTLLRTPRWMEEQGCGYALKIRTKDILPAVERLRENQIALRRIYAQRSDGQLEEITL